MSTFQFINVVEMLIFTTHTHTHTHTHKSPAYPYTSMCSYDYLYTLTEKFWDTHAHTHTHTHTHTHIYTLIYDSIQRSLHMYTFSARSRRNTLTENCTRTHTNTRTHLSFTSSTEDRYSVKLQCHLIEFQKGLKMKINTKLVEWFVAEEINAINTLSRISDIKSMTTLYTARKVISSLLLLLLLLQVVVVVFEVVIHIFDKNNKITFQFYLFLSLLFYAHFLIETYVLDFFLQRKLYCKSDIRGITLVCFKPMRDYNRPQHTLTEEEKNYSFMSFER